MRGNRAKRGQEPCLITLRQTCSKVLPKKQVSGSATSFRVFDPPNDDSVCAAAAPLQANAWRTAANDRTKKSGQFSCLIRALKKSKSQKRHCFALEIRCFAERRSVSFVGERSWSSILQEDKTKGSLKSPNAKQAMLCTSFGRGRTGHRLLARFSCYSHRLSPLLATLTLEGHRQRRDSECGQNLRRVHTRSTNADRTPSARSAGHGMQCSAMQERDRETEEEKQQEGRQLPRCRLWVPPLSSLCCALSVLLVTG